MLPFYQNNIWSFYSLFKLLVQHSNILNEFFTKKPWNLSSLICQVTTKRQKYIKPNEHNAILFIDVFIAFKLTMSAQVNKRVYQLKTEPDCTLSWTISTIRCHCDSVTFLCWCLVSRRFKASFDANEAAQFTSTRWTVLSAQIQKSQTTFLQRKNENGGQLYIYKTLNKRPSFVNNPHVFW